jgi:hypothetical protein
VCRSRRGLALVKGAMRTKRTGVGNTVTYTYAATNTAT